MPFGMPPLAPPDLVLAVLLVGAMWTDWKTGKIKNVLTFPVMATGVLMAPLFAPHFYDGALGLLAAFAAGVVLWKFGGAYHPGDVKLVMAAGALVGPEMILRAILLGLLINFPVAIAVLLAKGRMQNFFRFWLKNEREVTTKMIFALVISAGVVAARFQPWPNLWGSP